MRALVVRRGIDLRLRMEERRDYALPMCVVVLVNNSHTICNVVLADDPDFIGRKRLPKYLKGVTAAYLEKYMHDQFGWLLPTSISVRRTDEPSDLDFRTARMFASYSKRKRRGS